MDCLSPIKWEMSCRDEREMRGEGGCPRKEKGGRAGEAEDERQKQKTDRIRGWDLLEPQKEISSISTGRRDRGSLPQE